MARKNSSKSRNSNKGPATDKVDSVSEDLNNENQNQESATPQETQAPQEPQTLDTPPIDSPEDVDDQSGVEDAPGPVDDDGDDEEEEPTPTPRRRGSTQTDDEEGMGFPRKNGKTVSVFSGKPHETVRNVGGIMVPMTTEEAVGDSTKGILPKTDAEVQEKLRKLGKL